MRVRKPVLQLRLDHTPSSLTDPCICAALLAPPLFLNVLANGDLTPSQLEAAMTATFYRVLLLTGTVSVVAVAAAARAWR